MSRSRRESWIAKHATNRWSVARGALCRVAAATSPPRNVRNDKARSQCRVAPRSCWTAWCVCHVRMSSPSWPRINVDKTCDHSIASSPSVTFKRPSFHIRYPFSAKSPARFSPCKFKFTYSLLSLILLGFFAATSSPVTLRPSWTSNHPTRPILASTVSSSTIIFLVPVDVITLLHNNTPFRLQTNLGRHSTFYLLIPLLLPQIPLRAPTRKPCLRPASLLLYDRRKSVLLHHFPHPTVHHTIRTILPHRQLPTLRIWIVTQS